MDNASGYACCFCGESIAEGRYDPVEIVLPLGPESSQQLPTCDVFAESFIRAPCSGSLMRWMMGGFPNNKRPPNKRLKLAGALVLREAVGSCPGGHGTFVHYSCAAAWVARSLSAIR